MWGTPTSLKGFFPGDDAQDPDIFALVAQNINPNVATDLLWNNQGTVGPITPPNYTLKITVMEIVNLGSGTGKVQLNAQNTVAATSATIPEFEVYLAASSTQTFTTELFRALAPPNCKFQVVAATTCDVVALARYIKGAGQ